MWYNISTISTIQDLFVSVNSYVPYSQSVLLVVFLVSYGYMKRFENVIALIPALFITMLSSIMMFLMGILADYYVYATSVLFALSVLMLYFKQG